MKIRNGFVSNSSSSSFCIMSRLNCRKVKEAIINDIKHIYHPRYIRYIKSWKNTNIESIKFKHELEIAIMDKIIQHFLINYKKRELGDDYYDNIDERILLTEEVIKYIERFYRREFMEVYDFKKIVRGDKILKVLIEDNIKNLIKLWKPVYKTIFLVEYASDGYSIYHRYMRWNIMPSIMSDYIDPYQGKPEDILYRKYEKKNIPFPRCIKFSDDKS